MANQEQLDLLRQGVEVWNQWRKEHPDIRPDLRGANLIKANLTEANLIRANLSGAYLREANLSGAYLREANLTEAHLTKANLTKANLIEANLTKANLIEANLTKANLIRANLSGAALREADLTEANLTRANLTKAYLIEAYLIRANLIRATLVETNLTRANLTSCSIYGISAWNIELEGAKQDNLVITRQGEPTITVDNLEVAQFIYLLLNNKKIRDVIDTIAKKAVLILGRFSDKERKLVLDDLRKGLRDLNYLPIVFDFARATGQDFTETTMTLTGLSCFIIADITKPKSTPLELQAAVPDYMVPFVPIIQKGEEPFSMFKDLRNKYNWVLDPLSYDTSSNLIKVLETAVVKPALEKRAKLLAKKIEQLKMRDIGDYL